MLIKFELIEAESGEEFVYQCPATGGKALIAAKAEDTKNEKIAWPIIPGETITFKILPGTSFYVRIGR